MKRILFFPSGPSDGGAPPVESTQTAEQINAPVVGKADTAPPPAATIVVEATKTERETNLEAEIAAERERLQKLADEKKSVELRNMELEDENRTLKTTGRPDPKPAAKKGWGFF